MSLDFKLQALNLKLETHVVKWQPLNNGLYIINFRLELKELEASHPLCLLNGPENGAKKGVGPPYDAVLALLLPLPTIGWRETWGISKRSIRELFFLVRKFGWTKSIFEKTNTNSKKICILL